MDVRVGNDEGMTRHLTSIMTGKTVHVIWVIDVTINLEDHQP